MRARSSAQFRLDRTACSNSSRPPPAIPRGATLISMLNWPISVWKAGSATSSSTARVDVRGLAPVVDEVELDLHAGHRPLEVELRLGQHLGQHVEATPVLVAEPPPVLPGEDHALDVAPHPKPPPPVDSPTATCSGRSRAASRRTQVTVPSSASPIRCRRGGELPVRPREVARVAPRDALEVVLVLRLGLPERPGLRHLGDDLARPQPRRVDVGDGVLGDALLLVVDVEDRRPVARCRRRCPGGCAWSGRGSGRRTPAGRGSSSCSGRR